MRIRSTVMYHSNLWVALKITQIEHFRITSTMNETNPSLITAGKGSTGMIGKTIYLDLSAVVPRKRKSTVMTCSECNSLVNISSTFIFFTYVMFCSCIFCEADSGTSTLILSSRHRVRNVNQVIMLILFFCNFLFSKTINSVSPGRSHYTNYKFLEGLKLKS